MNKLREEARSLRQQGLSINEIVKITGASKSSISVWVRDIVLNPQQIERLKQLSKTNAGQKAGAQVNKARFLALRQEYQEAGRVQARQNRPLHLAGCMLYWAEGAKSKNEVHFVNSDSQMVLLFMRFLREELSICDEDIALHIHCHATDELEIRRIESYWLDLLQLPTSCLKKTQIKKGVPSLRYNILHNGICGIKVHNTAVVQHIYGAIQEYAGFDHPDWLF